MAAEEGFEPSQTESESAVLPLHNSAISPPGIPDSRSYCITKNANCQAFFAKKMEKFRSFLQRQLHSFAKSAKASLAACSRTALLSPGK